MQPSSMKLTDSQALRCRRCGRWPDQSIGIRGDWICDPVKLCPGCYERMVFKAVHRGLTEHTAIMHFITGRLAK